MSRNIIHPLKVLDSISWSSVPTDEVPEARHVHEDRQGPRAETGVLDRVEFQGTIAPDRCESFQLLCAKVWRMHFFTALQLTCLVILYALKEIKSISVVFPFFIALLGPIKTYLIQPFFTDKEMAVLRTLATEGWGRFLRSMGTCLRCAVFEGAPDCLPHFSGDTLRPDLRSWTALGTRTSRERSREWMRWRSWKTALRRRCL